MKNIAKLFRLLILMTVLGFVFFACDNGSTTDDDITLTLKVNMHIEQYPDAEYYFIYRNVYYYADGSYKVQKGEYLYCGVTKGKVTLCPPTGWELDDYGRAVTTERIMDDFSARVSGAIWAHVPIP